LNNDVFLITDGPNRTVFDDGKADILTDDAGRDWFMFNFNVDGDSNTAAQELVTDEPGGCQPP
jgi:hypothetical protein